MIEPWVNIGIRPRYLFILLSRSWALEAMAIPTDSSCKTQTKQLWFSYTIFIRLLKRKLRYFCYSEHFDWLIHSVDALLPEKTKYHCKYCWGYKLSMAINFISDGFVEFRAQIATVFGRFQAIDAYVIQSQWWFWSLVVEVGQPFQNWNIRFGWLGWSLCSIASSGRDDLDFLFPLSFAQSPFHNSG